MRPHLGTIQLFAYGFLSMPIAWGSVLLITFVPTYYAINLGLGLGVVGGLFVAGRILDVITDPLIGFSSDRTRTRFGARLPWMMAGMITYIPLLFFVLLPTGDVSIIAAGLLVGLLFIAYTLLDLPYSATGLEISPYPHERTVLASVKAAFQIAGSLAAGAIVAINGEDFAAAFAQSSWLIAAGILFGIMIFIRNLPAYPQPTGRPPPLKAALRVIWSDHRYRTLMIAFLLTQTASALLIALAALFMINYFGDGALIGVFIMTVLCASAAALPIWLWASKRYGKVKTWRAALLGGAAILWLVPTLVPGNILHYGLFCVLIGGVVGADSVLPTSLLADISDEIATEESGNAGMMLGYKNALSKLGFIVPMGLAFPILGAIGFDDGIVIEDARRWVLIFFYALLPALLRIAAFYVMRTMDDKWRMPA